jgi:hypothetical protein
MKPLEINEYKNIFNAWIDPDGILYECSYMGHNEWAMDYFKWKNGGDFFKANVEIDKIHNNSFSAYPYTALEKLGWIRILTWTSSKTGIYGEIDEPNKEQQDTLMFWCSMNNINFDNFIKKYNES